MGFRRAKSTQGNTNCQKYIFEDDQVPGNHPRALKVNSDGYIFSIALSNRGLLTLIINIKSSISASVCVCVCACVCVCVCVCVCDCVCV